MTTLFNRIKYILFSLQVRGRGWVFVFLLLLVSCGDEEQVPQREDGPLPEITWVMSSGRFRIQTGETIQLVPDIEYLDETSTYTWTFEGDTVGHENY